MNIPKIAYLYWGGTPLSLMRYMTVLSFTKLNPDWEVVVFRSDVAREKEWETPEHVDGYYTGEDYIPFLEYLPKVTVVTVPNKGKYHPVICSDIFRANVMRKGGFWTDFDVFFLHPMSEIWINQKSIGFYQHHTIPKFGLKSSLFYVYYGFMFSNGDDFADEFFGKLAKICEEKANNKEYQAAGSPVLTSLVKNVEKYDKYRVALLDDSQMFPVQVGGVYKLYKQNYYPSIGTINLHGIHWFGGNPESSKYEFEVTLSNIHDYDNYLLKLMRKLL